MEYLPACRADIELKLAAARAELESRVRAGLPGGAEALRDAFPDVWGDPEATLELVYAEYVLRVANGESPIRADWYVRFPQWRDRLDRLFSLYDLMSDAYTPSDLAGGTIASDDDNFPVVEDDHPTGYELLGELGRGGMAVVYKARHLALNRLVALKVLRGGAWVSEDDRNRIRREAHAAAQLQHVNIVQIYEVGDWDGVPFLSLEYVAGGTLAGVLARAQRSGNAEITPEQSAELVQVLARAMQYAHDRGIVHRDLKPANILIANQDQPYTEPKIADFGLALTHSQSPSVTQTAALAGTPCFMAPEQADARRSAVGPRTDVYALGGVLYELLVGRPPFQGATVLETLDMVRNVEPVAPRLLRPRLPRDLETICLKCLQKDPDRRYDSAATLADDLKRFRDGRPIAARPIGMWDRGRKWCRRHPVTAALLGGLAVAVSAAIVLPAVYWHRAEDAREMEAKLRREAEAREAALLIMTARLQWLDHDLDGARESLAACNPMYRNEEWEDLRRACRSPVTDIRTGDSAAKSLGGELRYCTDGSGLLLSRNGRVRIWDPVNGTELLVAGTRPLGSEFVHTRRHEVIEVEGQGTAKGVRISRFDLRTGVQQVLWESTVRTDRVRLSADGKFAVARTGRTLSLIDLTNRGEKQISWTVSAVRLAVTNRGELIGLLDVGRVVSVLDAFTAAEAYRIVGPTGPDRVVSLAINPDCTRAAFTTGVVGHEVTIVICSRGKEVPDVAIPTGLTGIAQAKFSPDGRLIAAWGDEGRFVRVWDTFTGQTVVTLRGHRDRIQCMDFSPDCRYLAAACAGGRVAVWDLTPAEN